MVHTMEEDALPQDSTTLGVTSDELRRRPASVAHYSTAPALCQYEMREGTREPGYDVPTASMLSSPQGVSKRAGS